ncbi:hypothetical protein N8224_03705 [Gammaproteobacteria bacterium]|nr:hypothetical protein [Gammaproteobacteria bacterium]
MFLFGGGIALFIVGAIIYGSWLALEDEPLLRWIIPPAIAIFTAYLLWSGTFGLEQ